MISGVLRHLLCRCLVELSSLVCVLCQVHVGGQVHSACAPARTCTCTCARVYDDICTCSLLFFFVSQGCYFLAIPKLEGSIVCVCVCALDANLHCVVW